MSAWTCAKCSHVFTSREAKCENWRIKELSLICPNCESYLKEIPGQRWSRAGYALAILVVVFGSIALMPLYPSLDPTYVLLICISILLTVSSLQKRKGMRQATGTLRTEAIHPEGMRNGL